MTIYADYEWYSNGVFGVIPEEEFLKYAKRASQEMDRLTFGRITAADIEEIKDCCCEMADILYEYDRAHDSESGAMAASYSNDGESASFDLSTSEKTFKGTKRRLLNIAYTYLLPLGLMYSGVSG